MDNTQSIINGMIVSVMHYPKYIEAHFTSIMFVLW